MLFFIIVFFRIWDFNQKFGLIDPLLLLVLSNKSFYSKALIVQGFQSFFIKVSVSLKSLKWKNHFRYC